MNYARKVRNAIFFAIYDIEKQEIAKMYHFSCIFLQFFAFFAFIILCENFSRYAKK